MNANIREGMIVRSSDGERLGKVLRTGPEAFTIEKGILFKRDFVANTSEIARVDEDEIWLIVTKDQLEAREAAPAAGVTNAQFLGREAAPVETGAAPLGEPVTPLGRESEAVTPIGGESELGGQQQRMTLSEEQLIAEKRRREVGEVKVRKEVHTEQASVTVPVTREEVKVERVPASEARPAERAFEPEEISVPVHEEEVEVRKRPVVREEVRVSATPVEEQHVASDTVRREEAHVEGEGKVGRSIDEDPDTRK